MIFLFELVKQKPKNKKAFFLDRLIFFLRQFMGIDRY